MLPIHAPTHLLIGLTGRPLAGKDTTATLLAAAGFTSIAFADALRAELVQAWQVDARLFADRETKELPTPALAIQLCSDARFLRLADSHAWDLQAPRSPRWAMQQWGTAYRRGQRPDYWTRQVTEWIEAQRRAGQHNLVVTDVRFPDEAEALRHVGGWIARVHRPTTPALAAETQAHVSEEHAEQLHADVDIHNDGDRHHLAAEALRTMRALQHRQAVMHEGAQWLA